MQTCFAGCPFKHAGDDPLPEGHIKVGARVIDPNCTTLNATHIGDADPGTTTNAGCTCVSACGSTLDDFEGAKCDWCYTDGNCGHIFGRLQHYDYCKYPVQGEKGYTWQQKEQTHWGQIVADPESGDYPSIAGIFAESIITSFENNWDYMPQDRRKYIHSQGVVCLMSMQVVASGYTGIFKPGTAYGMIRMGSALNMGSLEIFPSAVVPGNGFKFFRTDVHSANWVSLYTLSGQPEYNFFKNNQSNHIPPPGLKEQALAIKFQQASNCITMVGLSDAARYDQDGKESPNPQFPYQLIFAPSQAAYNYIPEQKMSGDQLLAYMAKIPANTPLFTVYAKPSPKSAEIIFGKITTTSQCTTSKHGDEKLFFKHQRMEDDLKLRPEWVGQMDAKAECGTSTVNPVPPQNCDDY